jgi:hypothetical protein
MSKRDVTSWDTVASYVAIFDTDDGIGACDVEVQIGKDDDGAWWVRTRDDAGGSDDYDEDEGFASEEDARLEAVVFAEDQDEGDGMDAEKFLRTQQEEAAGEPDPEGEWCVYWVTALEDSGPRERYETREQAEAACNIANDDLHRHNPGDLLCGFSVRCLVDGEWVDPEEF